MPNKTALPTLQEGEFIIGSGHALPTEFVVSPSGSKFGAIGSMGGAIQLAEADEDEADDDEEEVAEEAEGDEEADDDAEETEEEAEGDDDEADDDDETEEEAEGDDDDEAEGDDEVAEEAEGDDEAEEEAEGDDDDEAEKPASDEMALTLRFMTNEDIDQGYCYKYDEENDSYTRKSVKMRLDPAEHDSTYIDTYGAPVMLNHSYQREDTMGKIEPGTLRVEDEGEFTSLMGDVVLSRHSDMAKRIYAEIQDGIGTFASMLVHMESPKIVEETSNSLVLTSKSWWAQNIGLVYQGAYPRAGAVGYSRINQNKKNIMPVKQTKVVSTGSATSKARIAKAELDTAIAKCTTQLKTGGLTQAQFNTLHSEVISAFGSGSNLNVLVSERIAEFAQVNSQLAKPTKTAVAHSVVQGKSRPDSVDKANGEVRCSVLLALARTGGEKAIKDAKIDAGRERELVQAQHAAGDLKNGGSVGLPIHLLFAEKAIGHALAKGDFAKAASIREFAAGNTDSTGFPGISTEDRIPALYQEAIRHDSAIGDFMPTTLTLQNESEFALQSGTVTANWVTGEPVVDTAAQRITTEDRKLQFRTMEIFAKLTRKAQMLVNAPAVYDITINDIIRAFNEKVFGAILKGSGNGEPQGIIGTTGVANIDIAESGEAGARLLAPSWSEALRYVYTVMANLRSGNAVNPGSACFLAHPLVINEMMTTPKDPGSGWYVADMMNSSGMPTIAGYKVIPYTGLTEGEIIFGKPDQGVLGFFSNTVEIREDSNIGGGGLDLRTYWDLDFVVARPEGFATTQVV